MFKSSTNLKKPIIYVNNKNNMEETLDIVQLIENNPIVKLKNDYQSTLIKKIKETFTNSQQKLFISSFYCYLNYSDVNDFIVKLNDIWKWIGFSRIEESKRLLVKNFIKDVDYRVENSFPSKSGNPKVGRPSEIITMNIRTFKKFCMKARTSKADEIHDYYIKLEELLHETIDEETNELRMQLCVKDKELCVKDKELSVKDKEIFSIKEKTLLDQNPENTLCIYYGKIDNVSLKNEKLIKFGRTNNLRQRVKDHKKTFTNFSLVQVYKVSNHIEIENIIKNHDVLKKLRRGLMIKNKNNTELLVVNESINIDLIIKQIIDENEYNLKNYKLMLEKLNLLESSNFKLTESVNKLEVENTNLTEKLNNFKPNDIDKKSRRIGSVSNNKYSLYAYQCSELRYKCGFTRTSQLKEVEDQLKIEFKGGCMKHSNNISYPFMNKVMEFILKDKLMCIGHGLYDGSLKDIINIINVASKLESMLTKEDILDILLMECDTCKNDKCKDDDPEIPKVRKAKRSIDQLDKQTGNIIATFESIESAGRALGLTTGTAVGIALRNKTLCKGYKFRYSGVSKEDQYADQPVIKICCSSGVNSKFNTIREAAKDCKLSEPGLRNRILTDVHVGGFHWKFDKDSSHYK